MKPADVLVITTCCEFSTSLNSGSLLGGPRSSRTELNAGALQHSGPRSRPLLRQGIEGVFQYAAPARVSQWSDPLTTRALAHLPVLTLLQVLLAALFSNKAVVLLVRWLELHSS